MLLILLASAFAEMPDRSAPPAVVPPLPFVLPDPEPHAIGGVKVDLVRVPGARKVEIHLFQAMGSVDLGGPSPAVKAMMYLQDTGTRAHPPDALVQESDLYDISVSSWGSWTESGVDLAVPREDLARGVSIFGEVVREPAWDAKELKRYKREMVRWYEIEAELDPANTASSALWWGWYPSDHPFGYRPDVRGWKKIAASDLAVLHARRQAEAPAYVLVAGDVSWAEIEPLLTPIVGDLPATAPRKPEPAFAPPPGGRVIGVEAPRAEQALLRLYATAPLRGAPDQMVAYTTNFGIGGSFLSRLNRNLREDKGYTYGADSGLSMSETRGVWSVSVDVPTEYAGAALEEIVREIDGVAKEGLTIDEITAARNSRVSGWNETMSTAATVAGFYDGLHTSQETATDALARVKRLESVTPAETMQATAKYLGPDRPRLWVIVGDRESIDRQLDGIGFPPATWITAEQAVMGDW